MGGVYHPPPSGSTVPARSGRSWNKPAPTSQHPPETTRAAVAALVTSACRTGALAALAVAPAATAAATSFAVATPRTFLRTLARRCVLRPLDQLLRRHSAAVLVLLEQLQADAPASLVDLLHEHVEDVAAVDHVLDVSDPARAHVRDVQQAVGALLELYERAELRRLDDLGVLELVTHLGLLRERLDRLDRRLRLRAVGRIDEDRAVFLDVDLHLVLGLERADRLAALADHP